MSDRAQRIARITRDVRREAYPAPRDPSEPLIVGNPRPRPPVLVMRADFVALAEELAETAALRAEVERLKAEVEALQHKAQAAHEYGVRVERERNEYERHHKTTVELSGLAAEVERLRGLIAQVEWAAGEGAMLCPWCEGALFHRDNCPAFSARGEVRR